MNQANLSVSPAERYLASEEGAAGLAAGSIPYFIPSMDGDVIVAWENHNDGSIWTTGALISYKGYLCGTIGFSNDRIAEEILEIHLHKREGAKTSGHQVFFGSMADYDRMLDFKVEARPYRQIN